MQPDVNPAPEAPPPHEPVMVVETLHYLAPRGGYFVDGTVGSGGHAAAILEADENNHLLGLDRDEEAVEAAGRRLARFGPRVRLEQCSYADLEAAVEASGWPVVNGILLDLGLSSPQLGSARGFSFRGDAPLDLRFDRRQARTASEILNTYPADALEQMFRDYGDLPRARRLALAICDRRRTRPWARTGELAELAEQVLGRATGRHLPAPTLVFQALRLEVNDELDHLRRGLAAAVRVLAPGGVIVTLSFHSGEDGICKNFFRHEAATCVCPPGLPVCCCGKVATLEVLTRKPLRPSAAEVAANSRAAPTKLRAARRLPPPPTGAGA